MENLVDLHIHTTISDGTKTPEEVLMEAEQLGVKRIAITDHESVGAYDEIEENRSKFSGIIVPGIELRTICQGRNIELLGYGISVGEMKRNLPNFYKEKKEFHREYFREILKVLISRGMVFPEDIEEQYAADLTILPSWFIRDAIYRDKKNLARNIAKLYSDRIPHEGKHHLYREWLINPQSDFYVDFKGIPDYEETIELIKMCGGKVFVPHIFKYDEASKDILKELLSSGKIDGIECYYPTFTPEQTQFLLRICESQNLFVSGGSDYHGANKPNELGRGLNNNLYIPEEKVAAWTSMLAENSDKRVPKNAKGVVIGDD